MPSLETIEIHSPKDATQMWRINKVDFDPDIHQLWGHADAQASQKTSSERQAKVEAPAVEEYAGDFLTDGTGSIKTVRIVDPHDKRKRKDISAAEYDPDTHTLWSEARK